MLDDPPHNRLLGPTFERGKTAGLIRHLGNTLCFWGDIDRPDMTFSVTKTYLAIVAGIAFDQRLITNLDHPISQQLPGIGFDDDHNKLITWRHLLQFTSEWEGDCFGVPDQIDRFRQVSFEPAGLNTRKGDPRELNTPGTYWEYNDIRINQFSLALMHLFGRPLPEVLREHIMQPIGASESWEWHGYENSWETVNGTLMQSVPGGGHWGGGMVISASDQALVAGLLLNEGVIENNGQARQLLSGEWVKLMRTPCDIAPFYGFFTWLNTGHAISHSIPENCFCAMGIGGQYLLHDPDNQLIAVYRWLDSESLEGVLNLTYATLRSEGKIPA